jgi:hypothetical protein
MNGFINSFYNANREEKCDLEETKSNDNIFVKQIQFLNRLMKINQISRVYDDGVAAQSENQIPNLSYKNLVNSQF